VQDARISTLYNVMMHFTLTCWIKKETIWSDSSKQNCR